jgi:hypothetical protein
VSAQSPTGHDPPTTRNVRGRTAGACDPASPSISLRFPLRSTSSAVDATSVRAARSTSTRPARAGLQSPRRPPTRPPRRDLEPPAQDRTQRAPIYRETVRAALFPATTGHGRFLRRGRKLPPAIVWAPRRSSFTSGSQQDAIANPGARRTFCEHDSPRRPETGTSAREQEQRRLQDYLRLDVAIRKRRGAPENRGVPGSSPGLAIGLRRRSSVESGDGRT